MKINIGGKDYRIFFHHFDVEDHPLWSKGTSATLVDIADDGEKKEICMGITYCSKKDMFCRAKGRKNALAKLLKEMKALGYVTEKAHKLDIWIAYSQQFKLVLE